MEFDDIPKPDFEYDEFDDVPSYPKCHCQLNLAEIIKKFGFELLNEIPLRTSENSCVCSSIPTYFNKLYMEEKYALKISANKTRLFKEFENYQKLPNSKNLVKSYDIFELDDYLILQMDLCNGGDIYGQKLEENTIWKLIHDISNALHILHSEDLIHLDVSPTNILRNDSNFKLADFGNVTEVGSFKYGDEGSGPYVAPEILNFSGSKENGFYEVWTAADIFSFGVVLIESCTGILAPRGGSSLYSELRTGNLKLGEGKYKCSCSNELIKFVNEMINPDPMMRPTAAKIMKHQIVSQFDY